MRFAAALLLLFPVSASALLEVRGADASLKLGGTVRTFGFVVNGQGANDALSLSRLRLELGATAGEHLSSELAVDGTLLAGAPGAEALALPTPTTLRITDPGPGATSRGANYVLAPRIDRLSLAREGGAVQARVGRQAIGAGSARAFPVLDVWAPFAGYAIDTEYKRGVDAARVTVPLSDLGEVEAVAALARQAEEGAYLARLHLFVLDTDLTALAGVTYEEPTIGLGLQRNVGAVGVYAEALARPGLDALRATVGAAWRFAFGLSPFVELHLSTPGAAHAADYPRAAASLAYRRGEMFLLARGYGAVGLDQEVGALLHAQLTWFQNLVDGSALLVPTARWDVGEETAIDLGALVGVGGGSTELGALPDVFFGDVRVYF